MLGTMMMVLDEADGLVSGAVHTTAHTVRPALQLIKTSPGCNLVSSIFFMCLPEQVLVFGDCAIVPNPTVEELADIAIQSADSAAAFGIEPRVAMLSYSTGVSGAGAEVEKVAKATELAKKLRPDLAIDGPLQYDAALMPDVGRSKAPKSPGRRQGHGLHLPGPQHRERDLQGGPAQRQRPRDGADAPGHGEAGERPLARLPRRGHRLHHRAHRHPGGAGEEPRKEVGLPPAIAEPSSAAREGALHFCTTAMTGSADPWGRETAPMSPQSLATIRPRRRCVRLHEA